MADSAKKIYKTVCKTLDSMKINYTEHEDDLVVTLGHKGEDMNHDLIIAVNEKQEAIQLVEQLPFDIASDKAVDVAVALSMINSKLLLGHFTLDFNKLKVCFELAQTFTGVSFSEATIQRLVGALVITVEEYDDKLIALNKGYLKFTDFAE